MIGGGGGGGRGGGAGVWKNLEIPKLIFTIDTSNLLNFIVATVWVLGGAEYLSMHFWSPTSLGLIELFAYKTIFGLISSQQTNEPLFF